MKISACGLICDECPFFGKECGGCYKVEGRTFWAIDAIPSGVCPLFNCSVNQRKYKSCGDCNELPCKTFLEMKDPNITEVEHHISIEKRVALLHAKKN